MEEKKENTLNQEEPAKTQETSDETQKANKPVTPKMPSKINMIVSGVSIVIIIVCAIIIFTVLGDSKISLDEYNQIKNGMTYDQVVEIIGGEGELSSEAYSTKIYTWDGQGSLGANAIITFQNGKVVSKAQAGLG